MKLIENIRKNTILLLLITIVVMYFVLKDDFQNVLDALLKADIKYIVLAFISFIISVCLKGYVNYLTVNNKDKISIKEAIKHNVIVQFFNGITPFSTGGQPMEIYMLTEHGISGSKATMIILQNFIFYQIALVIFGLGAVLYNAIFHIFPNVPILRELVLIGFVINTLVAIGILLISISKKFTTGIMNILIIFLEKVKIVKNKEETIKNWQVKLEEFHECARILRKRKKLFVLGILYNLLSLGFLYIIPLFITYSMHDFTSLNILDTLTSSAYVLLMGAFVPIPGASGGIEYGYMKFFGNFLSKTKASATLVIWRFITYYFGMIIGMIVFNMDEREKHK